MKLLKKSYSWFASLGRERERDRESEREREGVCVYLTTTSLGEFAEDFCFFN